MSDKIINITHHEKAGKLQYYQQIIVSQILALKKQLKNAQNESQISTINHAIAIKEREYQETSKTLKDLVKPQTKSSHTIFTPLSYADLKALPEKEWLLNDIFGAGDLGMIFGAPGCGKTFVVIDMIVQMCRGSLWAHRFGAIRPLNVAYCAGEGISALPARFTAAVKHYGLDDLPNFTFYKNIPQLYDQNSSDCATILQFILEWKKRLDASTATALDVLVIDTLHTAIAGADENSSQDMGLVLQACRLATQQLGCTVILVHHTNKDGITERGSSSVRGAMDFMIRIKKPDLGKGTDATIFCEKLKDGEIWREQSFCLSPVEASTSVCVSWDDPNAHISGNQNSDKERLLRTMRKYPDFPFGCKALSDVIGQKENYTLKLLNKLVEENKCKVKILDEEKKKSSRNPWVYFTPL